MTTTAPDHQAPSCRAEALAPRSALPEVQGLVEKAYPNRLYGWAWNASRPGERVTVELRLGDAPVAKAVADLARRDLEKAGVGDGRHAFELPLDAEWIRRASELSVIARTADGVATPIPMRARRQASDASPPSGALRRSLDDPAAGQERLTAGAGDPAPPPPGRQEDAVQGLVVAQAALSERLDALALMLARLDERLAATAPPRAIARGRAHRRLDVWQAVLFGLLGALAAAGVAAGVALGG